MPQDQKSADQNAHHPGSSDPEFSDDASGASMEEGGSESGEETQGAEEQSPRALLFMEWSDALKSAYNALFNPMRSAGKAEKSEGKGRGKVLSRNTAIRLLIVLVTGIALSWLLTPTMYSVRQDFDVSEADLGRVSQKVIKADRDYDIPDTLATQRQRDEAWNSVPPFYEEDLTAPKKAEERIQQSFQLMRNALDEAKATRRKLEKERSAELERIAALQAEAERKKRALALAVAQASKEAAKAEADKTAQAQEGTDPPVSPDGNLGGEKAEAQEGSGAKAESASGHPDSEAAAQEAQTSKDPESASPSEVPAPEAKNSQAKEANAAPAAVEGADNKAEPEADSVASKSDSEQTHETARSEGAAADSAAASSAEDARPLPRAEDLPPLPTLKELTEQAIANKKQEFRQILEVSVSDEQFNALADDRFSESTQALIEELVRRAYIHGVTESRDMILSTLNPAKLITLQRMDGQTLVSESEMNDVGIIAELWEIPRKIQQWMSDDFRLDLAEKPVVLRQAIQGIAERQIRINLTYDQQETESRRTLAAGAVAPVVIQLKKGEKIIGDGEKIEQRHLLVFAAIRQQANAMELAGVRLGIALLSILFMLLANAFARSFMRRYAPEIRDEIFMAATLLFIMAIANLLVFIGDNLRDQLTRFTSEDIYFVIPVAAGAMLIRVILTMESACVFALVASALTGFIAGSSLPLCIYTLAGSLAAITCLSRRVDRSAVFKSGMWTALSNLIVVAAMALIGTAGNRPGASEFIATAIFAVIGGALLSPALVTTIAPICERFGYTTDMKLMELNNLNHPLIKRLMTEAPGTYNHSSQLTALVEAGAEAVGANPLLAKVCALYHDVGKLTQPTIFAENQMGTNPLSGMKPIMASKSIQSHVTEGYQLACDYRLPTPVAAATLQHHGTRVTGFFYKKALNDRRAEIFSDLCAKCASELNTSIRELPSDIVEKIDEESDKKAKREVKASDFSYPGPIPQSIEVALVMLADVTEATTRAQRPGTQEELKSIIRRSVDDIFKEGQLADCDLTLKDLNAIEQAFFTVLKGSNHSRPKYPPEAKRRHLPEGGTVAGILSFSKPPKAASQQEAAPAAPKTLTPTPVPLERLMPSKPPSAVPAFVTQVPTILPTPIPKATAVKEMAETPAPKVPSEEKNSGGTSAS